MTKGEDELKYIKVNGKSMLAVGIIGASSLLSTIYIHNTGFHNSQGGVLIDLFRQCLSSGILNTLCAPLELVRIRM